MEYECNYSYAFISDKIMENGVQNVMHYDNNNRIS